VSDNADDWQYPAAGIPDFAVRVLATSEGWWLIVAGCGVGFLFAVVALCISVVSRG
jgi:uncharacterized membrane protein